LNADLDVVKAGRLQLLSFGFGEADRTGDQVGVQAKPARNADELRQIATLQRLSTREMQLEYA
jgi:hypothetical protein